MDETLPHRMTPQEVDAVCALARLIWQATYPALISQAQIDAMLADRYAAGRMRAQLDDPDHAWWVVKRNQATAGFVHALREGAYCKLDKLYVHPGYQRQGIGTLLLRAAASWARQQQARCLRLQVNRGNTQAIAAYLAFGFSIIESRVFDIGDGFVMDAHVMEFPL